jgi:tetratricopeptide (TPR) repeat protein
VTHTPWLSLGSGLTAIRLLVWPWPMNVAYLDAAVRPDLAAAVGALLFLLLAGLACSRAAGRGGLLGLAWMAAFLLPVSGLVPLASYHLHERFLYVPVVGLALIAAGLVRRFEAIRIGRLAVRAVAAVAVAAFALVTVSRVPAWRDDETLWQRQVDDHPGSWVGHFYLARHRLQAGEIEPAVAGFRRTLDLAGDFAPAWMELGFAHSAAGRHRECLEAMLAARRANPRLPTINANVAVAYRNLGRRREAAEAFRAELRTQPTSPRAHYDLAAELLAIGEPEAALEAVDGAVALAPEEGEPRLLRGLVLLTLGRRGEAEGELQALRRIDDEAARRLARAMAAGAGGRP